MPDEQQPADQRTHVLLVDDQPANLLVLEALLGDLGYNLVKALSGQDALRLLLDHDFAVILLDVQMDDLDGFETARLIRARKKTRHIPIIFLTAYEINRLSVAEAYALGAVDYLVKPVVPVILRAKVAGFVELFENREQIKRQAERLRLAERGEFDRQLAERAGLTALRAEVALTLATDDPVPEVLQRCAEAVVRGVDAAFARVWTLDPEGDVLELRASAGLYTHLDGPHSRVRVGDFKIGWIAQNRQPLLTNAVPDDARVSDPAWARREGMVAFAGYPLAVAARVVGVLALFARHPLSGQVLTELTPVADGIAQYLDRKRAEGALRASEGFNRGIVESSPDCVKVLDLDGRLLSMNERGRQLLEIENVDLSAMANWSGFWQGADREAALRAVADARAGGKGAFQGFCPTASGTPKWWDVAVTPILDAHGRPERLLAVSRDITNLKNVEAALKDADRRKDEFLAMLAHELRNALAPTRNAVQVIRLAREAAVAAQARELVERQIDQMSRLVDDLMDISRISCGKIHLRQERVELAALVKRAVEMSGPLIESAGHRLTVTLPPERLFLEADATRLAQVLVNLLNNAAKYTERGGRIWLTAEPDGDAVLVRVRDTGVGIPPETLPHLFDLFSQADRTLERSQGGLGIGLSLVKRLVELHGGRVTAHSDGPGKGSEFRVRLPVRRATGASADGSENGAPKLAAAVGSYRVLVVDDNRDAAESLALLLRLWGHDARTALDGPDALELADAFVPEVVFLDIGLPGKDGYEVVGELRRLPGMTRALLVALTGFGSEEDQRRCLDAGFNRHLIKPVDLEAVEELFAGLPRDAG